MNRDSIPNFFQLKNTLGGLRLQTRKNQLWLLIILSALTMTIPYYIQGAMAGGKAPVDIGATVWLYDHRAWAIRAIVEGLVIGYIARTNAVTKVQSAILWCLEIALIALIAVTLGPTLYASMNGERMLVALAPAVQWVWSFALASYMPLMVLGASYAYKVQPDDTPQSGCTGDDAQRTAELAALQDRLSARADELAAVQTELGTIQEALTTRDDQLVTMQTELVTVQSELSTAQSELSGRNEQLSTLQTMLGTLQTMLGTTPGWNALDASAKAQWIAQHTNGDRPPAADLAAVLNCSVSTITRAYGKVSK